MKIQKAESADKHKILKLLNNVFETQQHYGWKRDEAYWHWKHESNVFGKSIVHIAYNNKEIIATDTLWPWKLTLRGRVVQVYQPCDSVVHANFQSKGIFSELIKYRLKELNDQNISLAFNFPNDKSVSGNLKFGWHYLAKIPWLVRPLNPLGMLSNKMSKSQASPVGLEPKHIPDWSDCYTMCADDGIYKGFISTYREKSFFEWRYQSHPFFKYGLVVVEQGRKKAAAVFSINQKSNSREMLVVDIFGSEALCNVVGKELIKTAKTYQADFVAMIYNPNFNMQLLWKLGFIKMRNKNMVVLPLNFALECKVTNYANWSLIGAMHDSI